VILRDHAGATPVDRENLYYGWLGVALIAS